MFRDFQVYIEDIINAIDNIKEYAGELPYESFVKDKKLLIKNLGVLFL